MIISCEKCDTRFRLEDERIPVDGTQVRCSRCGTAFFVIRPESPQTSDEEDLLSKSFRDFNHEAGVDAAIAGSAAETVAQEQSEQQEEGTGVGDLERSDLYAAEMDAQAGEDDKPDEMDWEFEMPTPSESSASVAGALGEDPEPAIDEGLSAREEVAPAPLAEEDGGLELDMGDAGLIGEDDRMQSEPETEGRLELETDSGGEMEIEGQQQAGLDLQMGGEDEQGAESESSAQENDFGLYHDPIDEGDCEDEEGLEDDCSMEGLLGSVADDVGPGDLEQIGTPENWNLLSDSRSELVGSSPPRVEDLSKGFGPEDLMPPTGSSIAAPVTADFSTSAGEGIAEGGSAEKIKVSEHGAGSIEPLRTASSPRFQKEVLAMGWAAALVAFLWAAFSSFTPGAVVPAPAMGGVDLAGYRLSKLEAQLIENRSGLDLLVVSGEVHGTLASFGVPALSVALFSNSRSDGMLDQAAIGMALTEGALREHSLSELRELTASRANAWGSAVASAGAPIPFQAIFADPSPVVTRFELLAIPDRPVKAEGAR